MSEAASIFGLEEERAKVYRGFNPEFVRRVWAERRKLAKPATPVAAPKRPIETDAEREYRLKLERERRLANEAIAKANEVIRKNRNVPASFDTILKRISRGTGIHPRDITGPSRDKRATLARQALMYWARRSGRMTLPQIAKLVGRDHTTVLHGKDKYVVRRAAMGRHLREVR